MRAWPYSVQRQISICLIAGACSLVAVSVSPASQQPQPDANSTPPMLATVLPHGDSGTTVVRNEREAEAIGHAPLTAGDIVRTDMGASAMLVLANHSIVMMLEGTEIEMRGPHRLRLRDGYITVLLDDWPRLLSMAAPDNGALLTIDVPHGVVTLKEAGDYDLDVEARTPSTSSALVSVHAGRAGLTALQTDVSGRDSLNQLTALSLSKGQAGLLRAGIKPRELDAPSFSPHRVATDTFVSLTRSLRDFRPRAAATSEKFPGALPTFAWLLEGHGQWVWDVEYGTNWVPYVSSEWRPYTQGEWVQDSVFGLTWRGRDQWWGWVTHHHGQWLTDRFGRWVWLPRQKWSPGSAPSSTAPTSVAVPRTTGTGGLAFGRREAEEAAVRVRHAQNAAAAALQWRRAWEQEIAIERERVKEEHEERARLAREARQREYVVDDDDDDVSETTGDVAPPRHGSSSSSSNSGSSSTSSGSDGSSRSRSSSGSSGAVPRTESSKAPPRHGSKP